MNSLFILFEGIDATGKTTLSELVAKNIQAMWTREPYCNIIREVVGEKTAEIDKLILFCNDRLTHNGQMCGWLITDDIVCDRYWLSNVAYQGRVLGYQKVLEFQPSNLIKPDILFYLSVPIEEIRIRMDKRKEPWLEQRTYDEMSRGYEWAMKAVNYLPSGGIPRNESHKCRIVHLNGTDSYEKNLDICIRNIREVRTAIYGRDV